MDKTWKRLLARQQGILTAAQAQQLGVPRATIHRRTRGERPAWQRVLPRVYATFAHPLTPQQKTIAAWLYAGEDAALTGAAAVHWWALSYLPSEVAALPVDVVVPHRRQCASMKFARITRCRDSPETTNVHHVRCVPLARAVADCARRLHSYDAVLALVASALNSGRTTLEALAVELNEGPTKGSRLLRRALLDASENVRSVPEAQLLALIRDAGLPDPLVNQALEIDGQVFVPDFRWGRLILEVDSRLHHLLRPGSYAATLRRRALLESAGYRVIPVAPETIRDDPAGTLAMVVALHALYAEA
jgi:very-short-patch-repair endonuclease